MTWKEVIGKKHHYIEISKIHPEAKKRLEELEYDDTMLFSFRLSGKQRVWTIRVNDEAYLLWWDPKHEICKSHQRNT